MDSKSAENGLAVPATIEQVQQQEEDAEYTPQPSGKRRKVAETYDHQSGASGYVVCFRFRHVQFFPESNLNFFFFFPFRRPTSNCFLVVESKRRN
jgi:hypothetical protein